MENAKTIAFLKHLFHQEYQGVRTDTLVPINGATVDGMRSTLAQSAQSGREAILGTATGVLNMAIFGAVWTAAGAGGLGGATGVVVLILGWVLAVALIVGSVRLRRTADSIPGDASPQSQARRSHTLRRFNLVFSLEVIAIVVAVFLLVRLGMGSWVPSVVALIVGLHFFPLASLFKVRAYHITGGALCALGLVTLAAPTESQLALVGIGSAFTLFVTSIYMLLVGARATRARSLKS